VGVAFVLRDVKKYATKKRRKTQQQKKKENFLETILKAKINRDRFYFQTVREGRSRKKKTSREKANHVETRCCCNTSFLFCCCCCFC
jgi:hypothetical protein